MQVRVLDSFVDSAVRILQPFLLEYVDCKSDFFLSFYSRLFANAPRSQSESYH